MASPASAVSTTASTEAQQTMEQKILQATNDGAAIVAKFSPGVAALIEEGVAVEPLFSGFAHMIFGLFHHHTGVKPAKQ